MEHVVVHAQVQAVVVLHAEVVAFANIDGYRRHRRIDLVTVVDEVRIYPRAVVVEHVAQTHVTVQRKAVSGMIGERCGHVPFLRELVLGHEVRIVPAVVGRKELLAMAQVVELPQRLAPGIAKRGIQLSHGLLGREFHAVCRSLAGRHVVRPVHAVGDPRQVRPLQQIVHRLIVAFQRDHKRAFSPGDTRAELCIELIGRHRGDAARHRHPQVAGGDDSR